MPIMLTFASSSPLFLFSEIKGATYTLRFQPLWYKVGFNRIVKLLGSQMFVTKNASQLLFDGYPDPLLELGKRLPPGTFPPFDKFAWFYQVRGCL